jgi:molecular chaperone GrpE
LEDVGLDFEQVEEGNEEDKAQETDESKVTQEPEAQVTQEEEELQTRYLRLAADFQNYKRRAEKEKNDIYAYANEKLIVELLNVIDNFDRAIALDYTDKGLLEGMTMIVKQFRTVLEKSGVEEIIADGEEFDPNFHHAVLVEKVDTHKTGQITQVLQKGYLLNKKVIRPAMVKVAE